MTVSPSSASIHLSTKVDWQHTIADHVELDIAGAGPATVSRSTYDPLWDGPYAQPAQPGDFERTVPASPATAALRDALAGLDLVHAAPFDSSRNGASYATVHLTFPQRPEGLDHLRPFRDADGSWTVGVNTSTDDLFADPVLAPVVDAARAVLDAAAPDA